MKSKAQQFRPKNDSRSTAARVTPPHLDRKKTRATASPQVEIMHYASSAFLNSPDPSKLPIPDFDDDEEENLDCDRLTVMESSPTKTMSVIGKTDTLKQFLNIRPVSN